MAQARGYELQGHRGARGLFPENTLEGFAAAIALGVDSLELDVALTADFIPVVTHDSRLNPDLTRDPDGVWLTQPGPPILKLTLAELQRFDVGRLHPGSRTALQHPAQNPQDGARIPTLAALFAHTATAGIIIDAELKTQPDQPGLTASPQDLADAVMVAAQAAGALHRLVVRSFDWRALDHMQRHYPATPLVWLTSPNTAADPQTWWGQPPGAGTVPQAVAARSGGTGGWAPEHADLTPALIEQAHRLGLRVLPWTVNEAADMTRLLQWGVDGLCTDRPDRAPP